MLSLYGRLRVRSRTVSAAIFLAMIAIQPASAEGDPARGAILADTCKGCHAVDSYTNVYPTYHVPRLAGQSTEYLVTALKLYRDGNREHPTMIAQAASYSDQDVEDIAAWLASVGPELELPAPDAAAPADAPEASLVCAACHGPAGVSPVPANPHLAGQHLDYLVQSLQQYKDGERKGPNAVAMQAQLLALSDEQIQEISAFYASQDGLKVLPMN